MDVISSIAICDNSYKYMTNAGIYVYLDLNVWANVTCTHKNLDLNPQETMMI